MTTDEAAVEQCDREAADRLEETEWPGNHAAWTWMIAEAFARHRHTERQRADRAEKLLEEAKEQFDMHVAWASDCAATVERQVDALGDALYRLSGPLRSSGFVEDPDNHQLYEAVVAAFREIGWKEDPLDATLAKIRSADNG